MERTCTNCQAKIIGRRDKKFCSDGCRNEFNNLKNSISNNYVRKVTDILRKNRRILSRLNPKGKAVVKKSTLTNEGFNFNYHTHQYVTKNGRVYWFCYEYGYYLNTETNECLLVLQQDYMIR